MRLNELEDALEFALAELELGLEHMLGVRKELVARAVWGSGPTNVFVVGDETILQFDGERWNSKSPGSVRDLWDVWGSGPNDVFALSYSGYILRFDGTRWRPSYTAPTDKTWRAEGNWLTGIWGSDSNNVIAAGRGIVMQFDGKRWKRQNPGTYHYITDVWGSDADNVFAVGKHGIAKFDGTRWRNHRLSGPTSYHGLHGVWGSGPNDVYAVGSRATILHYEGTR